MKGVGWFIPDTAPQPMSAMVEAYQSRKTTRAVKADCSGRSGEISRCSQDRPHKVRIAQKVLQVPQKSFALMKGTNYPTGKCDPTFLSSDEKHPFFS